MGHCWTRESRFRHCLIGFKTVIYNCKKINYLHKCSESVVIANESKLPYLPVYNAHFFTTFKAEKLHCALYTEPFVS